MWGWAQGGSKVEGSVAYLQALSLCVPGGCPSPQEQLSRRGGPGSALSETGAGRLSPPTHSRGGPAARPQLWLIKSRAKPRPGPGSGPAMASGARSPSPRAAWGEVRSDPHPGRRPNERAEDMAVSLLLPPPPWKFSLPATTQRGRPGAWQPAAGQPSRRKPRRRSAPTPRAAGPAAAWASPPASPGQERRPLPCDSEGLLDERRLIAHLKLALGREARLWPCGRPQVPVPTAGPSREHLHPLHHACTGRGRGPPAPALR